MWQYSLDDDHLYDLRELPVGGWTASKIKASANGRWVMFRNSDLEPPINPSHPINYRRRYVPPKTPLDHALCGTKSTAPAPSAPSEFVLTRRSLSDMNDEDKIRRPPVIIADPVPTVRSVNTSPGTLRDRALRGRRRPRTQATARSRGAERPNSPTVNCLMLANDELPDGEPVSKSMMGRDPYKPPFRVSQTMVRKEFRAIMKAEATGSRRPRTSMAARLPHVADLFY